MSERIERITIKLFKEEKESIIWLASKENMKTGTFIRKLLLDSVEKKKKEKNN